MYTKFTLIICLLETRVKQKKMKEIVNRIFPCWNMFHNYSEAYNERIQILWIDIFKVNMLAVSDQSISCYVEISMKKFYFSAIYKYNDGLNRRILWSHLKKIHKSIQMEPWILAGDFNVIVKANDSSSFTNTVVANSDIKDFTKSKDQLSKFDHAASGPLFTWTNKH